MRRNRLSEKLKYKSMSKGFTMIELMVVILILAVLAVAVVPNFIGRDDEARVSKAKADINAISASLKMYRLDNGFYPTTEQGLKALIEAPATDPIPKSWKRGYLEGNNVPKDPWGNDYVYREPGEGSKDFDLISLGKDGKEGGTDYNTDISN